MKEITNEQAAYIAGFLEGEGSFFITKNGSGYCSRITVAQKESKPLEHMYNLTGVGKVDYRSRLKAFYWTIGNKEDLVSFIRRIYPYLIGNRPRKRAKYTFMMAKLPNGTNQYKRVSLAVCEEREKIYSLWEPTRRKVR